MYNEKGFRWAEDAGGFALFNTIVPPSSAQFTLCLVPTRHRGLDSNASDGHSRTPTATTPAAPTSCSPTAASTSSSRRSPSRRTGRWGPRPMARSSHPIATDLGRGPAPTSAMWACIAASSGQGPRCRCGARRPSTGAVQGSDQIRMAPGSPVLLASMDLRRLELVPDLFAAPLRPPGT